MKKQHFGLLEKTPDERDFNLGAVYTLPKLSELPQNYVLTGAKIKNQQQTDFCASFSACTVSEFQENVELAPEWCFAVGKMFVGDVDSWGMQLRDICKVHTKYGAVEKKDCPISVDTHDAQFLRRIENYPDLFDKALYHKKASYFAIEGQYDAFDNIRASIWKFKDTSSLPIIGVLWDWSAKEKYIKTIPTKGYGHALAVIGWVTKDNVPYLVIQNSWGEGVGEKGLHYFSREVINKFVVTYGAYMFTDLSKEEAEDYLKYGKKADDINLLKKLLNLYYQLLDLFKKKEMETNQQKLLRLTNEKLGTDFTPDHIVPNEFSCAFAVSKILKEIIPDMPIIVNTGELYRFMLKNTKIFREVKQPIDVMQAGYIVISPTGYNTRPDIMPNGHCGIYLDDTSIASNSSDSGLWLSNFTRDSWRQRYYYKGGYPIKIFTLV